MTLPQSHTFTEECAPDSHNVLGIVDRCLTSRLCSLTASWLYSGCKRSNCSLSHLCLRQSVKLVAINLILVMFIWIKGQAQQYHAFCFFVHLMFFMCCLYLSLSLYQSCLLLAPSYPLIQRSLHRDGGVGLGGVGLGEGSNLSFAAHLEKATSTEISHKPIIADEVSSGICHNLSLYINIFTC